MATGDTPVAVVTGGSRGAGKGIALALAREGYLVYVSGRSRQEGDAPLPGTVFATAEEIRAAGGQAVGIVCDHADDAQVARLFEQVRAEQGRIDILVNNACAIPDELVLPGPFWEKPLHMQMILDVGFRSSYVASWHAAPLMVARRSGLIVNTSSYGGTCYMHGPAYGAGKAGVDKMAHDFAVDLRPFGVAAISLYMGLLITERTQRVMADPEIGKQYAHLAETMETPQLSGLVIAALARDPGLMGRSGKVWVTAELAVEYGIRDVNGRQPPSHRPVFGDPIRFGDAEVA